MSTIVETRDGRLAGRIEEGLVVFRGIPYARPPIGALRFAAPQPPPPWAGVRDAFEPGPIAPQTQSMVGSLLGLPPAAQSEDCLTLQVWTPACDAACRPVLVWIHGGGFVMGAGSQPLYDGATLARRGDVVVVTLNYRLGALGWLALPGLDPEAGFAGNLGLLDQIAALEWVRDNAAVFGGDPDQVTIFGESAGGMSVGTLLGSDAARRGLFQRAIAQSGAAHNASSPEHAERIGRAFLDALGLSLPEASRLRDVPLEKLIEAQVKTLAAGFGTLREGLPFQPVLDGTVLPKPPLEAIASGSCAGVPILAGTNLDEWKLFGLADPKLRGLDDEGLVNRCARLIPGGDQTGRGHAERAVETYRGARAGVAPTTPGELFFAIETDRVFRIPAIRLAEAAHAQGSPVQKYLFTHASPALGGVLGSCHALEVPFVFGSHTLPGVDKFTGEGPAVDALARTLQDVWLSFARSGVAQADSLDTWPRYEARDRHTMRLDIASRVESAPMDVERAFWDGLR